MALVKNDQRRRNGWQHNPTTSRDISSDCRRNFSKVRMAAPFYATSCYPNTSPGGKRKGAEARSQEQMPTSELTHHSPQISRNSKLSNYNGVSEADCTKRCISDLGGGYQKIRNPRRSRRRRFMVSRVVDLLLDLSEFHTPRDVMLDDSICSEQSCSTVVVDFHLSQSATLSLDVPLHQNFHVSIKKCIAVATSTRGGGA
jgi:hypothetical protein